MTHSDPFYSSYIWRIIDATKFQREPHRCISAGFLGESSSGFGVGTHLRDTISSETFSRSFAIRSREKERRHASEAPGRLFVSIVLTKDLNR